MRTIFSTEDCKNVIDKIFNANLRVNGETYSNPNDTPIALVDNESGEQTTSYLAKLLNVQFYCWKDRLETVRDYGTAEQSAFSPFDDWVQSLNYSFDTAYALVEVVDEEVTASQDIDYATKIGNVTFLMQTNKVKNLDYYVNRIRNLNLGKPFEMVNSYGDKLTAYFVLGTLTFGDNPVQTPIGECVTCTANFRLTYVNSAMTYDSNKIEISFDGDDTYDSDGNILGETKYLTMPITKATMQTIIASVPVPMALRTDLTGFVGTSLTTAATLSFFDYYEPLTLRINDLFWQCGAYRVNGKPKSVGKVNIPVYLRVTSNGNTYVYKDMVDNIQKVISNNDFNISSITLKGWGKTPIGV